MTDARDHWCTEETTYNEFTGCLEFVPKAFVKDKLETCKKQCKDKGSTLAQLDLGKHGNEASKEGACSESFSTVHKICENYKDDADVKKLLDEISDDKFMKLLMGKLPEGLLKLLKTPQTAHDVDNSPEHRIGNRKPDGISHKLGSIKITMQKEDEVFGKMNIFGGIHHWLLRQLRIVDTIKYLTSKNQYEKIMSITGFGPVLPLNNHIWGDDIASDEAFSRYFFEGIGAVTLVGVGDEIVHDSCSLAPLEVRPDFRRYGARVKFNTTNKEPLEIYDCHKKTTYTPKSPKDKWQQAKHLAESSVSVRVTAVEHLTYTHLLVAQVMLNNVIEWLPNGHSMRKLLGLFLFRTAKVNDLAARTLVPKRSIFHHATGFTYPSIQEVFALAKGCSICWQPFPEWASDGHLGQALDKLVEKGEFAFINDGVDYYNVVHNFVEKWVDTFFSSEAALKADTSLIDFYSGLAEQTSQLAYKLPKELNRKNFVNAVSQFIFIVTGFHEVVGSISEHLNHWQGVCLRITPESNRPDIQGHLIALTIMGTTSVHTPNLIGKYENYFVHEGERAVWEEFQTELKDLSAKIKVKNEGRVKNGGFNYHNFDPEILQVAVSV